jgi:hypothetical protein
MTASPLPRRRGILLTATWYERYKNSSPAEKGNPEDVDNKLFLYQKLLGITKE